MGRTPLRALALAVAAFIILGIADSGLGVAWPSIREFLGRDLSDLGVLLAGLSAGYLVASSSFGLLERLLGLGRLLLIGTLLLAVSAIAIAGLDGWLFTVAAIAAMGLGAGLIDVGMNAHAALEFDRGSINNLHAAYGIGATIGPLLLVSSLNAGLAWRGGYAAMALLQIGVAYAVWVRRSRWAGSRPHDEAPSDGSARLVRTAGMLAVFWVYTGVEVAVGQWSFSLLTLGRGMGTATAGVWVALYWGGLTAGRLGFGLVGERITASRTLDYSIGLALAGLALLWWDPGGLGMLGLPITGAGLAAVFPTMVALTPARIGRLGSTRMIGYQLAAANIGAATIPWGLGLLAATAGIAVLPAGLFTVSLLLGVLHLWVDRTG